MTVLICAFAISAVDIVLWDLRARRAGEPLWKLLGGHSNRVKAYAGGIDLALLLEALLDQAKTFIDRGFRANKMRAGQEHLSEDVERIAAPGCLCVAARLAAQTSLASAGMVNSQGMRVRVDPSRMYCKAIHLFASVGPRDRRKGSSLIPSMVKSVSRNVSPEEELGLWRGGQSEKTLRHSVILMM